MIFPKIHSKNNNFLWIGTTIEGERFFINQFGSFMFLSEENTMKYVFLSKIKNSYWVLAIMPIGKLRSMLGKIVKNDSAKMRIRFYHHIREAHRENRRSKNNLF
jgi:hypothetical protein